MGSEQLESRKESLRVGWEHAEVLVKEHTKGMGG